MTMQLLGLSVEWDEDSYGALLNAAQTRGGHCVLALRRGASQNCLAWVESRSADLESSEDAMRWPGTVVYDESDKATLLKFRVTPELVEALRSAVANPFEWLGPDLPEDLSFLRPDGRPWFVSIAHERDAFFKVTDDEAEDLREQLGGVVLVAQGDDQAPDERY